MIGRIIKWNKKSLTVFKKLKSDNIPVIKHSYCKHVEKNLIKILNSVQNVFEVRKGGGFQTHKMFPWLFATSDGVILKEIEIFGVVEVKTTNHPIKMTDFFNKDFSSINKNSKLYLQIQHSMFVFEVSFSIIIIKSKEGFFSIVERFDFQFYQNVFRKIQKFYFKFALPFYVQDKNPSVYDDIKKENRRKK